MDQIEQEHGHPSVAPLLSPCCIHDIGKVFHHVTEANMDAVVVESVYLRKMQIKLWTDQQTSRPITRETWHQTKQHDIDRCVNTKDT